MSADSMLADLVAKSPRLASTDRTDWAWIALAGRRKRHSGAPTECRYAIYSEEPTYLVQHYWSWADDPRYALKLVWRREMGLDQCRNAASPTPSPRPTRS